MRNQRNKDGVKDQIDCYRTINGELYIAWMSFPSDDLIKSYRSSGLRCRRFGNELYLHADDKDAASELERNGGTAHE